ncbi:MAG: extradiol ring-cleavage dioxygenase [Rhodospirillales bacterium]|nr:extradiol ring-cleavage dioxygenase [Rhodospirillales bacterium]
MADLVLALATSHSPILGSAVEDFALHGERDKVNPRHLDKEGRPCAYEDLLASADPAIAEALEPDVIARRVEACRQGIARLAETLEQAAPDVLIIVGDDQQEQFLEDNMPAMLVYWGDTIENDVLPLPADAPAYWRRARSQFHEEHTRRTYPVDALHGLRLIEGLIDRGFDISHSRVLPRTQGEGHAFGFVHRRLMGEQPIPIIPVVLNTYFPPNQPTPERCSDLGGAIADTIKEWDDDARVAIIASGGLSHFTIDEDLDRGIMTAIRDRDGDALRAIPRRKLNSGNSEIRNWITVAAAAESLTPAWQHYEPCYRTSAGTGCGIGFAIWN